MTIRTLRGGSIPTLALLGFMWVGSQSFTGIFTWLAARLEICLCSRDLADVSQFHVQHFGVEENHGRWKDRRSNRPNHEEFISSPKTGFPDPRLSNFLLQDTRE